MLLVLSITGANSMDYFASGAKLIYLYVIRNRARALKKQFVKVQAKFLEDSVGRNFR